MYKSNYYVSMPLQLEENLFLEVDPFINYGVDYTQEEELVDRRYFVPSSAAVSSKSTSHIGLYDSPEMLKSDYVSSVNASIRRPGTDVTEMQVGLSKLQAVAEGSLKQDIAKAQAESQAEVVSAQKDGADAVGMD